MPGATPKKAYPYPLGTELPDVPYAVQQLAQAVENGHQAGTVAVPGDGTVGKTVVVTFATPFAVAPIVVATATSDPYVASVTAVTTTTVSITLARRDLAVFSTTPSANWHATRSTQ